MEVVALPIEQVVVAAVLVVVLVGFGMSRFARGRKKQETIQLELDHEYRLRGRRRSVFSTSAPRSSSPTPRVSAEQIRANLEAIRRSRQASQQPTFTSSPPSITGPFEIPIPPPIRKEDVISQEKAKTDPPEPAAKSPVRITVEKPVLFEELEGYKSRQQSLLVEKPPVVNQQPQPDMRLKVPQPAPPPGKPNLHPDMKLKVLRPDPPQQEDILEIPATIPPAPRPFGEIPLPSLIDVTGQSAKIPSSDTSNGLTKYPQGVPHWEHVYIYSTRELVYATPIQQDFYQEFRKAFHREEYYDLEGNSNYAFILLFQLVESYTHISDLPRVERALERLGEFYPKTRTYIRSSLYDHMNDIGDAIGIEKYQPVYQYGYRSTWEDAWLLGNKHKKRLGLSDAHVKLLNKIPYQRNVFLDIQFCGDEVMRLFLRVASTLEKDFERFGSPLTNEIAEVYDVIARKHFRYRKGSANYRDVIASGEANLLDVLFRYCENAVREQFGNKRKRSVDQLYRGEAHDAFEDRFVSKLLLLIEFEVGAVERPDRDTEIALNSQNPTRWKAQLDKLKETTSSREFVDSVIELEKLNEHNQARENIYFEASKFVAKSDKNAALELFVRYVDCDLRSDKFDNKKLTKTVQKSLFSSPEQIREFEQIIDNLIRTKDLNTALAEVSKLYVPKRKRIKLSSDAIQDAKVKHSGTVDLLNEYLQDEEPELNVARAESGEIELRIPAAESVSVARRSTAIELKPDQYDLLEKFEMSGFALDHQEVEAFATARGLFKNQLVEGVNEACYLCLDDVLIEEEDDGYVVFEEYFKKIFTA